MNRKLPPKAEYYRPLRVEDCWRRVERLSWWCKLNGFLLTASVSVTLFALFGDRLRLALLLLFLFLDLVLMFVLLRRHTSYQEEAITLAAEHEARYGGDTRPEPGE